MLARVHAVPVDPDTAGALGTGPPETSTEPPPGFFDHPLAAALVEQTNSARRSAAGGSRGLVHADFWPGNTLSKADELVGIDDWENASLGDPVADVAYCATDFRY